MLATRGRFASDGESSLYATLVKVYGPHSVQGHVGMGDVVASERMGLSDAELRYLRLAHFDFVIWDEGERAVAVWEYDGEGEEPVLHKEELTFENVTPSQRSYK